VLERGKLDTARGSYLWLFLCSDAATGSHRRLCLCCDTASGSHLRWCLCWVVYCDEPRSRGWAIGRFAGTRCSRKKWLRLWWWCLWSSPWNTWRCSCHCLQNSHNIERVVSCNREEGGHGVIDIQSSCITWPQTGFARNDQSPKNTIDIPGGT
jgi:hypothetical protein